MLSINNFKYLEVEGMTQFLTIRAKVRKLNKKEEESKEDENKLIKLNNKISFSSFISSTKIQTTVEIIYSFFKRSSLKTYTLKESQLESQFDGGKKINVLNNPKFKLIINSEKETLCEVYGTPKKEKLNFISKLLNKFNSPLLPFYEANSDDYGISFLFKFYGCKELVNQNEVELDEESKYVFKILKEQ